MAAAPIPYLHSYLNAPNPLLQNPQKPIAWLGYSAVFGVFSYYAPKTFKLASVGIFAGSVLWFNQISRIFNAQRAADVRLWVIQACQVMWSVGIVFGVNGIYSLGLSAKMLKEIRILNSLSAATSGILGMAVLGGASYFWARAKQLSQRARWIQMEDYLNYPSALRNPASLNFDKTISLFLAAFFPGVLENKPYGPLLLAQFCSAEGKIPRLIRLFPEYVKVPSQESSHYWKTWVLAIHQLEDVINQQAVTDQLKNALRRIAKESEQSQVDQLPATAKSYFNALRQESSSSAD